MKQNAVVEQCRYRYTGTFHLLKKCGGVAFWSLGGQSAGVKQFIFEVEGSDKTMGNF